MEYFTSENLGEKVRNYLAANCPSEIISILDDDTVLSGGTVVKALTDEFRGVSSVIETPYVRAFIRELVDIAPDMYEYVETPTEYTPTKDLDFDIYTSTDGKELAKHFSENGYEVCARIPPNFSTLRNPVYYQCYGSWIIRMCKRGLGGDVNVDLIIVNKSKSVVKKNNGEDMTAQQFIMQEFDFNVCKVWYDGKSVGVPNAGILEDITERVIRFDFHRKMTTNTHKMATTLSRLIKYRKRGFAFKETDEFLKEWKRKFLMKAMYKIMDLSNVNLLYNYIFKIVEPKRGEIIGINERNRKIVEKADNAGETNIYSPGMFEESYEYGLLERFYECLIRNGYYVDTTSMPVNIATLKNGFFLKHVIRKLQMGSNMNYWKYIIENMKYPTVKTLADIYLYLISYVINLPSFISTSYGILLNMMNEFIEKKFTVNNTLRLKQLIMSSAVKTYLRKEDVIKIIKNVLTDDETAKWIRTRVMDRRSMKGIQNKYKLLVRLDSNHVIKKQYLIGDEPYSRSLTPLVNSYESLLENGTEVMPILHPAPAPEYGTPTRYMGSPVVYRTPSSGYQSEVPPPIPGKKVVTHSLSRLIRTNIREAEKLAKRLLFEDKIDYVDLYNKFDIDIFDECINVSTVEIDGNLLTKQYVYGNVLLALTTALEGTVVKSHNKVSELGRRSSLAKILSSVRPLPGDDQICKNYDLDYIYMGSFEGLEYDDFLVMGISYGSITTFYCMTKEGLMHIYDDITNGDGNIYNSADRSSRYDPRDGVGSIVKRYENYVSLPIDQPMFIDLYSFYIIIRAMRKMTKTEILIPYIEMVSSDVLIYTLYGSSSMHAAEGDARNIYSLGKILMYNPETKKSRSIPVGELLPASHSGEVESEPAYVPPMFNLPEREEPALLPPLAPVVLFPPVDTSEISVGSVLYVGESMSEIKLKDNQGRDVIYQVLLTHIMNILIATGNIGNTVIHRSGEIFTVLGLYNPISHVIEKLDDETYTLVRSLDVSIDERCIPE